MKNPSKNTIKHLKRKYPEGARKAAGLKGHLFYIFTVHFHHLGAFEKQIEGVLSNQ